VVCEPIHHVRLEVPADTLGAVMPLLARLRVVSDAQEMRGTSCVLECAFDRYLPVRGTPPIRARTDHNPLNRKEYLLHVLRCV
jgi:ribosomal protection tetracycline resistance protein